MNVLIIAANRNRHPAPVIPYGACMNNGLRPADWVLMASCGAGLSAHALLLRSG